MTTIKRFVLATSALLSCATVASAALTAAGPFTGTYSETFESFPDYFAQPGLYLPEESAIMGGFATISSANQDMAIYNPGAGAGFGLNTSYASVSDGAQGLGLNSASDTATIKFSSPVTAFGGYFGADYGGPYNGDVSFGFSDGSSESFTYSDPSEQNPSPLIWDGWDSSVGITSVTISGSYLVMDGLQANGGSAPDGGMTSMMLGGVVLGLGFLRKKLA